MLIPETGAGVATANSYCSLEQAAEYMQDRAYGSEFEAFFALDPATQAAVLIRATEYVEAKFHDRLQGCRASYDQALSFPRSGVYVDGQAILGVPLDIIGATCHVADALASRLDIEPKRGALPLSNSTGVVREKRKLGALEKDITYSDTPMQLVAAAAAINDTIVLTKVTMLLRRYMVLGSGFYDGF